MHISGILKLFQIRSESHKGSNNTAAMSNLNYIFPFFIVEHMQQSAAFYVDKLGFEVRHMGPPDDPF